MSAGIIELNDSNFDAEAKAGVVLIDFWAPWCGPCRMQTPILEQIAGQVEGAKIAKLNVDEAPALAAKFGVMSIPTLIVLKDGQPVEIHGGEIHRDGVCIAKGLLQSPEAVRGETDQRRAEIGEALESFARNTVEHMLEERELLSGRIDLPRFDTDFRDRHALIVVGECVASHGARSLLYSPHFAHGTRDAAPEQSDEERTLASSEGFCEAPL
mgnify:CR=1 FL=1